MQSLINYYWNDEIALRLCKILQKSSRFNRLPAEPSPRYLLWNRKWYDQVFSTTMKSNRLIWDLIRCMWSLASGSKMNVSTLSWCARWLFNCHVFLSYSISHGWVWWLLSSVVHMLIVCIQSYSIYCLTIPNDEILLDVREVFLAKILSVVASFWEETRACRNTLVLLGIEPEISICFTTFALKWYTILNKFVYKHCLSIFL